jgi:hypothetical protein
LWCQLKNRIPAIFLPPKLACVTFQQLPATLRLTRGLHAKFSPLGPREGRLVQAPPALPQGLTFILRSAVGDASRLSSLGTYTPDVNRSLHSFYVSREFPAPSSLPAALRTPLRQPRPLGSPLRRTTSAHTRQNAVQRVACVPHCRHRIGTDSRIGITAGRWTKQNRDIKAETPGNGTKGIKRRALLPTLHLPDELVGQPRSSTQLFLAPATRLAQLNQSIRHPTSKLIHVVEYSSADSCTKPSIEPNKQTPIGASVRALHHGPKTGGPAAHDHDAASALTPTTTQARRPTRNTLRPAASNTARGSVTRTSPRRTAPS